MSPVGMSCEWASAKDTAFWTIGREDEAPDRQTLEEEPPGTIGLVLDGGGGGGYVLYGQPEEIAEALHNMLVRLRQPAGERTRLAAKAVVDAANNAVEFDGVELPWHTTGNINVTAREGQYPTVTVSILAKDVEIIREDGQVAAPGEV